MMLNLSHEYLQNINLLMLRFEKKNQLDEFCFGYILYQSQIVDLEKEKKKKLDSGP